LHGKLLINCQLLVTAVRERNGSCRFSFCFLLLLLMQMMIIWLQ